MSSIYVRSRNRGRRLLHVSERPTGVMPRWLVAVGVGTAGCRRTLLLLQRMSELSALHRIQSAVFYDCNDITVAHVQKFLQKFLGRARSGAGIQILFPNYIPLTNGFMRDPRRFEEYQGPMERDMDNIVSQVMLQSEHCGRPPEVIIEFMSFAGHATLGGRLHQKLSAAFPSSVILPVMMLPRDHVAEEWTRRFIWERYEDLLSGSSCLVTTQSDGHAGEDDVRLATGLVELEVADFEDETETVGSPLRLTLRRLEPASGGWLGMATVKRKMPLMRKFEWLRFPPWWREYAALGSEAEDKLSVSLGNAIWSTMDQGAQMAEGVNYSNIAPQEVVVSLPVHADALEPMAADAADVLERNNFFEQFPNIDIAFTTARFAERITKEPYLHVARIYPISGELGTVSDVLHSYAPSTGETERTMIIETGFGSKYHLYGTGRTRQPAYDDGGFDPGDGSEQQNIRYL